MKKILGMLLALCMTASISLPALAIEEEAVDTAAPITSMQPEQGALSSAVAARAKEETGTTPPVVLEMVYDEVSEEADDFLYYHYPWEAPYYDGYYDGYSIGWDNGYLLGAAEKDGPYGAAPKLNPAEVFDELDENYATGAYEDGYDLGYRYGFGEGYYRGYYEDYMNEGYEVGFALGREIYETYDGDYEQYYENMPEYPYDVVDEDHAGYLYQYGMYLGYDDGYWTAGWEQWEREEEAYRHWEIAELGGTPGQINVMVNGSFIPFPDAAPEFVEGRTMVPVRAVMEALGAKVSQEGRQVEIAHGDMVISLMAGGVVATVEQGGQREQVTLDVPSYIREDRTYVPLRFLSELMGYDVLWDDAYYCVVMLDREALIASVDGRFTAINTWLATQSGRYETVKEVSTTIDLSLEALDSIDGNITNSLTASVQAYVGQGAMVAEGTIDLTDVPALLDSLIGFPVFEAEWGEAAFGIQEFKIKVSADGGIYCQMALLEDLFTPGAVTIGERETWFYLGKLDFSVLQPETYTVGNLLYSTAKSYSDYPFYLYSNLISDVAEIEAILGDKFFTKQGQGYSWNFGLEEFFEIMGLKGDDYYDQYLINLYDAVDFTMTFSENGRYKITGKVKTKQSLYYYYYDPVFNFEFIKSGSNSEDSTDLLYQLRNSFNLTLNAKSTIKATQEEVDFSVPDEDRIVDLTYVELMNLLYW